MVKIKIDKKSGKPLYAQIRDRISQAVRDREILPGDKLPTVAVFAKEIGVTQATIRRALADLKHQGLTRCHVGRGTFVAEPEQREPDPVGLVQAEERHGTEADTLPAMAARRFRRRVSKGLCDLMSAADRPGTLDFAKGYPDPGLVSPGMFKQMAALALEAEEGAYLPYGDLQGMPELRTLIADRYKNQGVEVSPDQVLITIGSQQGASIAALDAAEKKRRVFIETPCFQGTVDAFVGHGNWVATVNRLDGKELAGQLRAGSTGGSTLLGICPDFQNPVGTCLTSDEKRQIAAWAKERDGILLSDEIFQDLRFEGQGSGALINMAGTDRTIVTSSLSKSLIPGLRIGWMISSARRIAEFVRIKRLMAQTGPLLMQGIAAAFLRSGAYDAHLERIKGIYKDRRDAMVSCLEQFMPDGVTWTRPQGGFYLWVSLPRGYSSVALLISLLDKGVNMVPGPVFDMDQRFVNAFRMGWAWTDAGDIPRGVEVLAEAVKELMRKPPGDAGLSGLGHF